MVLGGEVKTKLLLFFLAILSAIVNFSIFLIAYKKLLFPLLHEDQRMDVAPYLFTHLLPSFIASSLVLVLLVHFLGNRKL